MECAIQASVCRLAAEVCSDGILVADAVTGRLLGWNTALPRILGLDPEQLAGKRVSELSGCGLPEAVASAAREPAGAIPVVVTLERRGTPFPAEVDCRVLPSGDQACLWISVRDISERMRAETQRGYADRLEALARVSARLAEDFNPADRARLLQFARKACFSNRPMNLNAVVREQATALRPAPGVRVRLALAGELGDLQGDPERIAQAVGELLVNAVEAMPQGGELVVETGQDEIGPEEARRLSIPPGLYQRVAVSDTGTGMSDEAWSRLFEPFYTTKGGAHRGLGLCAVHGIVRQSSGCLWVSSQPGAGSQFRIYLPASVPDLRPEPSVAGEACRDSTTLLVLEDRDGIRALLRKILSRASYTVLEAGTREEALDAMRLHAGAVGLLIARVPAASFDARVFAADFLAVQPDLPVLYILSQPEGEPSRPVDPGSFHIEEPFPLTDLLPKVREALGTPAPDLSNSA